MLNLLLQTTDSTGHPRIVANSKGKKRLPRTRSLFQALKCHDIVFIDFIERCLQWDPAKRLTPKEALHHEFITNTSITPPKPVQSFLSSSSSSMALLNQLDNSGGGGGIGVGNGGGGGNYGGVTAWNQFQPPSHHHYTPPSTTTTNTTGTSTIMHLKSSSMRSS